MRINLLLSILVITFISIGCSSGSTLIEPELPGMKTSEISNHHCLGYYQFIADPVNETLDFIPLREVMMHLNALPFLEPPALLYLSLESLEFNGNIIDADIGLRHPFLGLDEFTGFDVCGIFITNGSKADFDDPDLRMAIDDDTRLLNPDGYSRWWNPAEFPNNGTMFGYADGMLGAPDSYAEYNGTLNGYKYFCDDLDDVADELSDLDPESRCTFSAGMKNIRHYTMELGAEGLIFNYAIDACWEFPQGNFPWHVPDDFGENANRPEAWNVSVTETENTLWNDGVDNGGDLSLSIDVWDHFNADLNTLKVESPGNFIPCTTSIAIGGGAGYSTYEIDITSATPSGGSIELLISIESEAMDYGGFLEGEPVTAYFSYTAVVDDEAPQTEGFHEHWAGAGYNHYNYCQNPTVDNLDPLNLTQVWTNTTSGSPNGFKTNGVAIADGKVFYVSETGSYYNASTAYRVFCLDLTDGSELWSAFINLQNETGRSLMSAAWYEDKVYTGGDHIYCFDDETGSEIWSYEGGANNYNFISNTPKVFDGKVYAPSRSGVFVCLNADYGTELWTFNYNLVTYYPELHGATDGERVYLPTFTDLYCLDCDTGSLIWTQPINGNAGAWSAPTLCGDRVYQYGWYGWLHCFDKLTGTPIWSYDIPGTVSMNAFPVQFIDTSDDKPVFVGGSASGNSPMLAIKDDGTSPSVFWSEVYGSGTYYDASCAIHDNYIIIGDRYNSRLLVIDKISGSLLTTYPLPDRITAQVGIAYDQLVVLTDDSVECYESI